MTNEDLQQLKALAEAATPGPWIIEEGLPQDEAWCEWHNVGPFSLMGDKADADDKFIAAANPAAILALIAKVESLAAPSVASGTGKLPMDPASRHQRLGEHIFEFAKQHGWKDDGEGAFEYIQRHSYVVGIEDAGGKVGVGGTQTFGNRWPISVLEDDRAAIAASAPAQAGPNAQLVEALKELCAMYGSTWDSVDGSLVMFADGVTRFEKAHAAGLAALAAAGEGEAS